MDRKSIVVLVVCFLLLMLWMPFLNVIFPPQPAPIGMATNSLSGSPVVLPERGTDRMVEPTISNPSLPADAWIRPQAREELVTFENPEARYIFTSHGGGLKTVELKGFNQAVGCVRKHVETTNSPVTLNDNALVPALAFFGGPALQDNLPFRVERTLSGVRAEKVLPNGVAIVKEFNLGTNYLIEVTVRVENRSELPLDLPLQELVVGTATPINVRDNGQFLGVQWYNGTDSEFINQAWFDNYVGGCGCLPARPRSEFVSAGSSNVVWTAVHNQFFAMIAAPQTNTFRVVARRVDLPPPGADVLSAYPDAVQKPFGYQTAIVYSATTLEPGAVLERRVDLFAGPKEYNTLAQLPRSQDLAMNFTTFFGWFAKALLLSMNFLHNSFGLAYGLAIIVITVLIKLAFWPLTQASTRSMKRMQTLQPQMKLLQEKYKDDPKKMNQKLMEFMKENRVNPMGGCLPILIQIPVFIGFYQMLQSAIELRGARFLWACDLSQPDTIAMLFGFPLNPLPLIMGATQFWQARMTPPSPGMDPVQAKMMQYMPLIFIVVLYNFSSGLALYWTINNLLSILQMKLTKVSSVAVATTPAPPARRPLPPNKKR